MKSFLFLLLLITSLNSYSQVRLDSINPTAEDLEMIYQVFYAMNSEALKERPLYYKTVPIDRKDYEVQSLPKRSVLMAAIESFSRNAVAFVEQGSYGSNLILESQFPMNFQLDGIQEVVNLDFVSATITANGKPIKVMQVTSTSFGAQWESGFRDGKSFQKKWHTIHKQNQIKQTIDATAVIAGRAQYDLFFKESNNHLVINVNDHKTIYENEELRFRVVDAFHNTLMLEIIDGELDEYKIVNNASAQGMEYKAYSLMELSDLYEKQPEARDADHSSFSSMGMYKVNYDLFRANPDLTLEEFKTLMPLDKLKAMQSGTKYKLLKLAGPIESQVEFYIPTHTERLKVDVAVTGAQ